VQKPICGIENTDLRDRKQGDLEQRIMNATATTTPSFSVDSVGSLNANPAAGSSEPQFACSAGWGAWWVVPELRAQVLDAVEKLVILILFSSFLNSLVQSISGAVGRGEAVAIGDAMLLITETMMVILVLCRRSAKDLSLRTQDWALAFSATCLSLLARPCVTEPQFWYSTAVCLTIVGLSTQLFAKLTLGRRFGVVAANRGICSSGPYRLVRHPIYFGYVMLHLGFFMLNPSTWNLLIFTMLYSIKIPRILAEERLLSRDSEYVRYMDRVRYRLIPGLF